MKQIKGSIIGKIIAWIVLLCSFSTFVMSAAAIVWMEDNGVFTNDYEKVRQQQLVHVSDVYSAYAIINYMDGSGDSVNKNFFSQKSFRYGIIEADSLYGLNFNQEKTYKERNFTEKVDKEMLTSQLFADISSAYGSYDIRGVLNNDYYIQYYDTEQTYYADRICYDTNEGIFYYRAEGKYYPVNNLEIEAEYDDTYLDLSFAYDTVLHTYTSISVNEATYTTEETYGVLDILENQQAFTFTIFDNTDFSYDKWKMLWFSGVRELPADELTLIDSSKLSADLLIKDAEVYLDENYTLHVTDTQNTKNYYVVSYIDEDVYASEKAAYDDILAGYDTMGRLKYILLDDTTDLYVLYDELTELAFSYRDRIMLILIGACILGGAAFIYLLCGAGYRRGRQELVLTFWSSIPWEIELAAAGGAFCGAVSIACVSVTEKLFPWIYLTFFAGLLAFCVFIAFILSFAVRIKAGKWWKNTICCKILKLCANGVYALSVKMGIVVKVIILCGGRLLVLCMILMTGDYAVDILLFTLLGIAEAAVIIMILQQMDKLQEGSRRLAAGELTAKLDTDRMFKPLKMHGENLNSIGEGMTRAVNERMKSEHFKTELITNVSHDIKTPLTSIINYVDLLEKTDIQDETQREYLEVLSRQSARLKKLIEDLIEASKASTGNLAVNIEQLDADVFLTQIEGEYQEKLAAAGLELILKKPDEPLKVQADGRHLWRVMDNLMNNICKYAMPSSRVYVNLEGTQDKVRLIFRNISRYPLNISSDELMERFVRGDSSRNTEGNGLGLSIAASLMELMNGTLELCVDGDLFKVVLTLPVAAGE